MDSTNRQVSTPIHDHIRGGMPPAPKKRRVVRNIDYGSITDRTTEVSNVIMNVGHNSRNGH